MARVDVDAPAARAPSLLLSLSLPGGGVRPRVERPGVLLPCTCALSVLEPGVRRWLVLAVGEAGRIEGDGPYCLGAVWLR